MGVSVTPLTTKANFASPFGDGAPLLLPLPPLLPLLPLLPLPLLLPLLEPWLPAS
jgi:hypothetical protein